jgi:hypothetical protein
LSGEDHKGQAIAPPKTWQSYVQSWVFALIPAVGLLELVAHLVQTHAAVPDAQWKAARDYVAAESKPEDLVAFAPRWEDPNGRMQFGPAIATLEREARPDDSRFPRAFEVGVHGAHLPEFAGWKQSAERTFGAITVTTLENPEPAHVLADLVSLAHLPDRVQVQRLEGDHAQDCPFAHGPVQSGGLGSGPAVPSERFVCPSGGFVATSVAADLDYRPHRCIYAPPLGNRGVLRIHFQGVPVGKSLHGHHGLYVEAERDKKGAPVTLTFRAGDAVIGTVVHKDGDGWKPFEFDTSQVAAQSGGTIDLVADIESPSSERRMYCFEADTR